MSYAQADELERRYGADEIGRLGDTAKIAAALDDARAEIDAVLGGAFALPLEGGPFPALTAAACALARLHLYDEAAPEGIVAAAGRAAGPGVPAGHRGRAGEDQQGARHACILRHGSRHPASRQITAGHARPTAA